MNDLQENEKNIREWFLSQNLTFPFDEALIAPLVETNQMNARKRTLDEANQQQTYDGPSIDSRGDQMESLAHSLDQVEEEEVKKNAKMVKDDKNESMNTEYGFMHYFGNLFVFVKYYCYYIFPQSFRSRHGNRVKRLYKYASSSQKSLDSESTVLIRCDRQKEQGQAD